MGRARLGRTNLDVSVASIGTGGFSRLGQEYGATAGESVRVLRAAMDEGIDFIDTAADYRTEEIVAKAVAGRRNSVVIATRNQVYRKGTEPTGDELTASGEVDPADLDPGRPLGFMLDEPSVRSLADACYRFNRHTPGADVILTSTGRIEHLRDNIASINSEPLPGPVLDRLHKIFGRVESVTAE